MDLRLILCMDIYNTRKKIKAVYPTFHLVYVF